MWIAVALATFLAWETWRVLVPGPVLRDRPIIVQIPPDESALAVAARLKDAGAIRSPEAFFVLSLAHGSLRALKAGEYEVPRSASKVVTRVLRRSNASSLSSILPSHR